MAKDPDDALPVGRRPRPRRAGGRRPPPAARARAQRRRRRRVAADHAATPSRSRPALGVETGRGPFVGREALLERLAARFAAASGERQFVAAGRRARHRQDAARDRVRAARARRRRDGPLWALGPRGARFRTSRSSPRSAHFVAHRETLVLPRELAGELTELARFVPELRRHVPELRQSLSDEPELRRFRLFEGVKRMLAFAARERPVVLLLDDLHWADASTTLLLGHLLQDGAPMRLLVVGTARTFEGELLSRLRRQRAFEQIVAVRADRGRDARARRPRRCDLELPAPADRGDRRATRSSSRRRCAACPRSRSVR